MKFFLFNCFFLFTYALLSQTNGQLFVKQKLQVLLSVADKDLESVKTICKTENGLINEENVDEVYTYTYQSPEQDYYVSVVFHFNRLFCKKIKIEITPTDNNDVDIGKIVTKVLKSKFKTKANAVTDTKAHTVNYFLSNSKFSGILSFNTDTKKIILVLSVKQD